MLDYDSGHSVDLQKYVRTPVVQLVRIGRLAIDGTTLTFSSAFSGTYVCDGYMLIKCYTPTDVGDHQKLSNYQ